MKITDCYDCGSPVSSSAARCPQCGSAEPNGPYRHSPKEIRRHRLEERNNRRLIIFMAALGAIGAFYGAESGSTTFRALMSAGFYSFLGGIIGVAIVFTLNMTRNWR
jgi:uncharacterized membrane protein YeaQ/YmgE (transglycosylase-associated protein family)